MNNINKQLYNATGNIIGIVDLISADIKIDSFINSYRMRKEVSDWGMVNDIDSVMLLGQGDVLNFRTMVFEPAAGSRDGLPGGFSTMCGNGIRALADYIQSRWHTQTVKIETLSGVIDIQKDSGMYKVNMGRLVTEVNSLSKYVDGKVVISYNSRYIGTPISLEGIPDKHLADNKWSIGFTCQGDALDGEPHIVIMTNSTNINDLYDIAYKYGKNIVDNGELFPNKINANFISRPSKLNGIDTVYNVTYERNLGELPNHSITAACGTGSTVVGAVLMENFLTDVDRVLVKNRGGDLEINKTSDGYTMAGSVKPIVSASFI